MKSRLFLFGFLIVHVGCSSVAPQAQSHDEAAVANTPKNSPREPSSALISSPLLETLQAKGYQLSPEAQEALKEWKGMDLEDTSTYRFPELSGSTSINLKVERVDSQASDGADSMGTFVPMNGAGNPNTEIAYFHLAAILGHDDLIRPAARYELGPKATAAFKNLINKTPIKGTNRLENKKNILAAMAAGGPLKGCMKAKKPDSAKELEAIANGSPKSSHPLIQSLQASNPQPVSGKKLQLLTGYSGDSLTLAREYSILMTLDSIFQQFDRYSGGNVGIRKDEKGETHIFSTDNGGASLGKTTGWVEKNLAWFSRYDRDVITKLREIYEFLENPSRGYLGYTNAEAFVVDLGLYFGNTPATYAERFKRNLKLLLDQVAKNETKYGQKIYFQ